MSTMAKLEKNQLWYRNWEQKLETKYDMNILFIFYTKNFNLQHIETTLPSQSTTSIEI